MNGEPPSDPGSPAEDPYRLSATLSSELADLDSLLAHRLALRAKARAYDSLTKGSLATAAVFFFLAALAPDADVGEGDTWWRWLQHERNLTACLVLAAVSFAASWAFSSRYSAALERLSSLESADDPWEEEN
ncbi:hypothetical protein [Luteolibacter sp. Populi]|uniref:hypothetical protein n=1 Tax=Luteolibacter sp. Populi TaxID=3230487 RepID=UPI0034666EEE